MINAIVMYSIWVTVVDTILIKNLREIEDKLFNEVVKKKIKKRVYTK